MDSEKTNSKSTRKRRRPGVEVVENASGDEVTNKVPATRTRRSQTKNTTIDDDSDNAHLTPSSKTNSITSTSTSPHESDGSNSAFQQVTRELHAQIMSKVRDLAPTIPPKTSTNSKPTSNPPTPTGTSHNHEATSNQNTASNPNSPSVSANKNTTQSVMEFQNIISQYVQRQRAAMASANNSAPVSPSNTPTSRAAPFASGSNGNQSRGTIPVSASTIIANKFNSAMMLAANSTLQHSTQGSNIKSHNGAGSANGTRVTSSRGTVKSMLDSRVPVMSIQYKQQQQEKRQRTAYYAEEEEEEEEAIDQGSNYFLNAAQHELQNMDEEMLFSDKLEVMEREIEHLERAVARRDRVIAKLHTELEEKEALLRSLPHELVSNWIAASRIMIGQ